MEHLSKKYYGGYKPKPTNVVKLEAYVKNANTSDLTSGKGKITNLRDNKVLKNKRIR